MKNIKGKFTLLINQESTAIEIVDENYTKILQVEISPINFQLALSRLSFVECNISLFDNNIDKIAKTKTSEILKFEIPNNWRGDRKELAKELAIQKCPKGYEPELYFGSKNSFFTENGKSYAQCNIHKYK